MMYARHKNISGVCYREKQIHSSWRSATFEKTRPSYGPFSPYRSSSPERGNPMRSLARFKTLHVCAKRKSHCRRRIACSGWHRIMPRSVVGIGGLNMVHFPGRILSTVFLDSTRKPIGYPTHVFCNSFIRKIVTGWSRQWKMHCPKELVMRWSIAYCSSQEKSDGYWKKVMLCVVVMESPRKCMAWCVM